MAGISLEKRTETATTSLLKVLEKNPTLGEVCAQVTLEIDISASMTEFYANGYVQEAAERALALSMTGLDDDGIVPGIFYGSKAHDPIEFTEQTYRGAVADFVRKHGYDYSTLYAPPIQKALGGGKKKLFGRSGDDPNAAPFLHIFLTDGAPADATQTERLLVDARKRPHFFHFIQFGNNVAASQYLDHLNNNLSGPGIDNVGVTKFTDPASLTDEQFYADIVSEFFPIWLPAARAAGITNK